MTKSMQNYPACSCLNMYFNLQKTYTKPRDFCMAGRVVAQTDHFTDAFVAHSSKIMIVLWGPKVYKLTLFCLEKSN